MTPQETFDRVVAHLRAQGIKSMDKNGCMYRGPNGTSCAVGCLIEDSEFSPILERRTINGLLSANDTPLTIKERLIPHHILLQWLQNAHDNYDVEDWEKRFQSVAERFNLIYTPKQ